MSAPNFLQIHSLTSYPASLLNRDDAGLAKRMPFGGAERIRVSSQCLKRHWRRAEGERSFQSLGAEMDMSVRSRHIFDQVIAPEIVKSGAQEDIVSAVLSVFKAKVLGESKKVAKQKDEDGEHDLKTAQVIVLGRPEIRFIANEAEKICKQARNAQDAAKKAEDTFKKEGKKNLEALKKAAAGLDAAVFGRMVTSDYLARGDAAVHVAHAFTVHEKEAEDDYFTAVDDLVAEADELGSGHLGVTELTSGLFYGYVVVDVPLLVSNLEGVDRKEWEAANRNLAGDVVETLVHLIAKVSPGAKLGSTAPYSYAHLMMVEAGSRQPRTLANAFLKPVRANGEPGITTAAVKAMGEYVKSFEKMYGNGEERRVACLEDAAPISAEPAGSLDTLASWAADRVRS